jgi:hypothetical protein
MNRRMARDSAEKAAALEQVMSQAHLQTGHNVRPSSNGEEHD